MTSSAIKTVGLYLVLVGIPALGVSQVIRIGNRIQPPISLGGSWRLVAMADSVCGRLEPDTLSMRVTQSGDAVEIRFARGVQLSGHMVGNEVRASGKRVRMRGRVTRDSAGRYLEGQILGAPCPTATRTTMTGVRLHQAGIEAEER